MIDFLKYLGVERVEIDIPPYGINLQEKLEINLSVYEPFSLLSYTLNCPFTFKDGVWHRKCKRDCLNSLLIYSGSDAIGDFFQCGKIYYAKAKKPLNMVDRIVYIKWKKRNRLVS